MKYLELTKEQYDSILRLSPVRHISDSGVKTALISRMDYYTKSGETFATNLEERLIYKSINIDPESLDDDNLYSWEYDVVVVPYARVKEVKDILSSKDKKLELK